MTAHSHHLHPLQGDNSENDPGCAGSPGLPGPPGLPGQRGEEVRPRAGPSFVQRPLVPEGSFIAAKCLLGPSSGPLSLGSPSGASEDSGQLVPLTALTSLLSLHTGLLATLGP